MTYEHALIHLVSMLTAQTLTVRDANARSTQHRPSVRYLLAFEFPAPVPASLLVVFSAAPATHEHALQGRPTDMIARTPSHATCLQLNGEVTWSQVKEIFD
jgi:hypothetical protein